MTSETPMHPSEEYEAHVIEFAFRELLMQESSQLEETPLTPEEEELLEQAAQSRQKHLDLIAKAIARQHRIRKLKAGLSAALRYASAIVLLISLTFGTALAVSSDFRVTVIELLTVVTDEYVNVGPERETSKALIPEDWMAKYYPGYIPKGYEISYHHSTANLSKVILVNPTGDIITYCVSNQQIGTQINAENALCQLAAIHDCTAYLYTLDEYSLITWSDGKQYHTLTATTQELLLDVVESLVDVRNKDS